MSESPRRLDINSSAIRIAGVGGLGMVALVVLIAADLQPARWLLAACVGGGASAFHRGAKSGCGHGGGLGTAVCGACRRRIG